MKQMVAQMGKLASASRHELEVLLLKREIAAIRETASQFKQLIERQKEKYDARNTRPDK